MERHRWTNAQYSRREFVKIVGMPLSIRQTHLEDSVCKILDKINCNIVKDNLEDCHRLKGDRVITKFSKRKNCMQVLIVKNDLKSINMTDLDFEGNGSIFVNQILCSYYKTLWSWSKKLRNMGRIYSWTVSGGTIKIKNFEYGDFVSVTHTDDFIKHFPEVDFTAFYNHK